MNDIFCNIHKGKLSGILSKMAQYCTDAGIADTDRVEIIIMPKQISMIKVKERRKRG